ncbi:uncharacterized protein K02A2.6-like [Malaya genurostris]|uniref:uncharacterized protein K02A2.6-like n=1 Tax=Malaya genurostris TaxID=325434 RepID=UPI0026F3920A|nr:uncharacterized protein K02A2.6-like [Malaya genurostris]
MADLEEAILQMATLLQKLAQPTPTPNNAEQTLEALATNISEFSFDPENGVTFEKWYSRYADLFDSDAKNLEDAAKVRLLLRKLDTPSHTRYTNYILPKLPKDINFTDTVEIIKKIFGSQTSVFNKRYQCLQLMKSEVEDIISYGGKVNRACEDFDFKNMKIDQFKCLVFVCGLKAHCYTDIRARLLSRIESETAEAPVTLQNLIDDYQRLDNLKADTSMIERQSCSKPTVHAVQEKGNTHQQQSSKSEGKTPRKPCWQCGQMHFVRDCPFSNHQCKQCNRSGHKEGYCNCFSKMKSVSSGEEKKLPNRPRKSGKAKSRRIFIVNHIAQHSSKRKYVTTIINGVEVKLQLDTASDITVISKRTWNSLGKPSIKKPTIQAMNASGKPLHLFESVEQRICKFKTQHAEVFNDSLGHCRKTKRPVPFNTISLVDAELTRLETSGIIQPVDFSEWAAPIVAVRKPNGRVRICADYSTGLNEALEANHYPLPTPDEIFAQLNGSTVFSIIDLSDAYLQLEVDDSSKKLLTINTHRDLYQFNRLAPGVKSAPGAFQRLVDGMISDIPGVRSFIDDVIVFSKDMKSHLVSLNLLFQRLKEYGFHVKAEKCHLFQTQLAYLGHIVDKEGIRPNPEKLKSIAELPAPTNVPELRSYLGAVNFYARFVRNMHELRHPMDQLLKKETKWQWTPECQRAFNQFKTALQSNLLLTHYDPKLPIIVAADASNTGIGARGTMGNLKKKHSR